VEEKRPADKGNAVGVASKKKPKGEKPKGVYWLMMGGTASEECGEKSIKRGGNQT